MNSITRGLLHGPVPELDGTVGVNLDDAIDEVGLGLDGIQRAAEKPDLDFRRNSAGDNHDQPRMDVLQGIQLHEVTSVVGDEHETFLANEGHQVAIRRSGQTPEHHVRRVKSARVRQCHQIGRQALVDQEWVAHGGRPAFSQARQASMPSVGSEG